MGYQGIKIYDKVIIIEKISKYNDEGLHYNGRTVNQGYVVDFGNTKMLESAMNWAEHYVYDESLRQEYFKQRKALGYENDKVKAIWQKYQDSETKVPGVVHEYDNGHFELTLSESADYSTAGGKLSFWNCIITCPDKKQYLIGINSELLLHLLMFNTFVSGTCQQAVWLGRIKGTQVGAFTSNMEEFAQAHKDEERRNTKKSVKYNQGDIIESLGGSREIYLGEFYIYGGKILTEADRVYYWGKSYSNLKQKYLLFYRPVKVHGYMSLREEQDWDKISHRDISFHDKKLPRIITNTSNYSLANGMRETVDNFRNVYDQVYMKYNSMYSMYSSREPQPYNHCYFAIMVRTNPNIDKEEIKADFEKVRSYYLKEQEGVEHLNISNFDSDLVDQYTLEAIGEIANVNDWSNYLRYMKKKP